jgi:hypothetical protein
MISAHAYAICFVGTSIALPPIQEASEPSENIDRKHIHL